MTNGKWEVRNYDLVLVNADSGCDYLVGQSDCDPSHIKLMYREENTYSDGSPSFHYWSDRK